MKEKIPRRAPHCTLCSTPLQAGATYVSHLTPTQEGYARADLCLDCWEKNRRSGQFWIGKIPPKTDKKQTPDEKALTLLRTETDPTLLTVLALYLQRRGQLMKRSESVYEIPESGEVVLLTQPRLTPEEGKIAGEKLVQLLDS